MKKNCLFLIATLGAISSPPSFAQFDKISVKDFNGSYKDPDGKAKASSFIVPKINKRPGETNIEITREDANFSLKINQDSHLIEDAPGFLISLESLNWKDLKFITIDHQALLKISQGVAKDRHGEKSLKELSAICNGKVKKDSKLEDQFLQSCLDSSLISVKEVDIKNNSDNKLLADAFYDILNFEARGGDITIKNLKLDLKETKMSLKVDVKYGVSVGVTASGRLWHDQDKKIVTIKIEKANAGIISFKDKLFDILKDFEDEKIKIQKPYVYISY